MHFFFLCGLVCKRLCKVHRFVDVASHCNRSSQSDGQGHVRCVSLELLLDDFAKMKILHVNVCRVVGGSLRHGGGIHER